MANQGFTFRQFCVLCAKSEEAAAVLDVFEERFERAPPGPRDSEKVFLIPSSGRKRKVVVSTCKDMGHVEAAVRTAEILATSQPSVMAFVGTAASLRPQEIQLGDVVVPRKAVYRSYDKISQAGQRDYEERVARAGFREQFFDDNALIAGMNTLTLSSGANNIVADLARKARNVALEKGSGSEIVINGTSYPLRDPKVHVDVDIVSCGMLVDSVSYRDFLIELRQEHRKLDVIDMESYGFFQAIETLKLPKGCDGIMVRGISDYAGRKQQTEAGAGDMRPEGWKSTAVRNAALVVAELFATLSPDIPEG